MKRTFTILTALLGIATAALAQELPVRDTVARHPAVRDSVATVRDSLAAAPAAAAPVPDDPAKQEFWKGWFGEINAAGGATAVSATEVTPLKKNSGFLFNGSALVSGWSEKDQFTVSAGAKNTSETTTTTEADADSEKVEEGLKTAAQGGFNYFTTRIKGVETSATANYKFTNTETGTSSELNEFQEEEFTSSRATTSGNTRVHAVTANAEFKKEKGKVWFHVKPLFRYTNTLKQQSGDTRTMTGQLEIVDDEEWRMWQEEQEQWRREEEQMWKEEMERWKEEMERWKEESGMSDEEWQRWYEEEMAHMQEHMQGEGGRDEYERRTRYGWAYLANNSTSSSVDNTGVYTTELNADLTLKELGGKKNRDLRFGIVTGYDATGGTLDESSELWTSAGDYESRIMHYDIEGHAARVGGSVNYVEPIATDWTLAATADVSWTNSHNVRIASDADGINDRFSSLSDVNNIKQQYDLTAQYKFGPQSWVSLGGMVNGVLNETFSKSKGVEDVTGEDDWYWFFTPTAKFQHVQGANRFTASISGNTQRPNTAQMLPVLDLRVPSRPGIGNIYLKPYSSSSANAGWTRNNKERGSSLSLSLNGSLNFNPIIYARWYDSNKIQYSLPVNSRKPGFTTSLGAKYSTPLGAAKAWNLSLGASAKYNTAVSYQAKGALPGIDKKNFDYTAFMADFWGDESGDKFYGGESGFEESTTQTIQPSANASIKFNQKGFDFTLGATTTGRIARYSLNPDINVNTLDTRLYVNGGYAAPFGLEARTSFAYVFYTGYSEGFGLPEYQWNAEISQKVGDWMISFKAYDILNQTRSLSHSVTGNYEEDTYRITMGRYFLLGVKWCFGKADAAHGQRARSAFKAMSL